MRLPPILHRRDSTATDNRHAVRAGAAHLPDRIRELLRRELRHRGEDVRCDCRRFFIAEIPPPLTTGTPFEQAQRTYQIASENFYAANFDTAAKMFDAIAADSSSPRFHRH